MFLDGKPVGAEEARQLGLVDEIVEGDLRAAAIAYARRLVAEGKGPRRVRDSKVAPLSEAQLAAFRAQAAKQHKGMITPELDIAAVRAAWELPFEQGLAVERAISEGSLQTPESRAMRHLFFAERAVADVPGIGPADKPREIGSCGIIGSGTMGGGIAMAFANVDIAVVLLDVDQAALDRGLAIIRKNYEASVKRGQHDAGRRRQAHGADQGAARATRISRDVRSGDRGRVRGHGAQEEDLHRAGSRDEARRHPRHQHLDAGHQPDRRGDEAAAGCGRPAFLQPGQRHAAAGDRAHRHHRATMWSPRPSRWRRS